MKHYSQDEMLKIVELNGVPIDEIQILNAIARRVGGEECFVAINSYLYGVMQGKRSERARRAKGGAARG